MRVDAIFETGALIVAIGLAHVAVYCAAARVSQRISQQRLVLLLFSCGLIAKVLFPSGMLVGPTETIFWINVIVATLNFAFGCAVTEFVKIRWLLWLILLLVVVGPVEYSPTDGLAVGFLR